MSKPNAFSARATKAASRPTASEAAPRPAATKKRLTIDLIDPDEYAALRQWSFDTDVPMTKLLRAGAVIAAADAATRSRIEAAARDLAY
ncbi:hypothetical protein HC251_25115 (plasmid) [Iamia sp. SCSIO 61187]|uniref:hypothetical protein n=1 Tax=Iamia sp. SCSIO 61187 TaxID=2722752 RepID=UPI001C625A33|nr:hypothetical protein [Iamia sp. SCSIO 61187]QYG95833.1 hypothetical protein HC251_25115 [Iamia sp. SCSIO 61187]